METKFTKGIEYSQQESIKYSEDDMRNYGIFYFTHQNKTIGYLGRDLFKIWAEYNKKK